MKTEIIQCAIKVEHNATKRGLDALIKSIIKGRSCCDSEHGFAEIKSVEVHARNPRNILR